MPINWATTALMLPAPPNVTLSRWRLGTPGDHRGAVADQNRHYVELRSKLPLLIVPVPKRGGSSCGG